MPNWKRIVVSGSDATLNTLTVSNGITGSLFGTASFATQALSASFAPSTPTFPFTGSAIISGSLNVIGSTLVTGSVNVIRTTAGSSGIFENNAYNLSGGHPIVVKDGLNSLGLGYGSTATAYFYTPAAGLYIHGYGSYGVFFEGTGFVSSGKCRIGDGNYNTGGTLELVGSGATSASIALSVQNSVGSILLKVKNDGNVAISGSLVAGYNATPLAGTIQDGVTSVLGSLNDWNSNFYQGTVLYSETAASTITFGQLCYRTQNETWDLADATAANSAAAYNMLGICVKSSTANNPTSILINGFVETATYATIVKSGEPLYMSITPGSMSKTAPTTVGNAVRIIGNTFWDSNTNTKIIIRFNPENSWIEL